ncbi:MAG: T9SS type A sorting domain-containing protein [Bacteroidetes bacterium]|nr:T9SS type A sorting domain-containing protein [Bacteroidota bacterium]
MKMRLILRVSLIWLGLLLAGNAYSQIYISEFMASNASVYLEPETGRFVDWIELYNPDPKDVDLSGFFLSDDIDSPAKWIIPDNIIIPAQSYLLFFPDKTDQGRHTSFGLAKEGEEVVLSNSIGIQLDYVKYDEQKSNVSFGRDPENLQNWLYFGSPTPGMQNGNEGMNRPVKMPGFSLSTDAGFYNSPITVSLTETENYPGNIHYTIDGSLPDETDPIFPNSLTIEQTTSLRLKAFGTGYLPGDAIAYTYFIGEQPRLPVFSISMDPVHLYDDDVGIYVNGSDFNGERESRNACTPDWERPMHIEYFESDGHLAFSEEAGIQVKGRMNCEFPRKPLGVYFRSRYGNNEINYPFFQEKTVTQFSSFILRPGGADGMGDCYNGTMFRDGLLSTLLIDQMDVDYEGYQPAVLFVNGEYWGIHNIRERNKSDYLAGNHGVDPDNLDLLENPANGGVIEGDDLHYMELMNLVRWGSTVDDQELEQVEQMVDLRELLNYQIAEIFVNNEDWAHNNVLLWRPRTSDGKWRWVFFDVEGGFGLYHADDYTNNLFPFKEDDYLKHATLVRKILTHPKVRADFIQGFAAHLNTTFSTQRVLSIIDSLYNNIAFEMPRDIARWTGQTTIGGSGCSCIESWDQWIDHVEIMREFARQRPDIIRQQIQNLYNLSGMISLDFENIGGSITLNGVENAGDGLYFRSVPLRMVAVPNPGYRFVGWEGLSDESEIELTLEQNTSIEAIFEPDGSSLLPLEIDDKLTLTAENSPYIGASDIIVLKGASLRLEPGVEIRMQEKSSIYVYGAIEVRGTLDQPVKISNLNTESERWGALVIEKGDVGSFINQLIIEKASLGRLNPSLFKANLNIISTDVPVNGLYISDAPSNPVYILGATAHVQFANLYSEGVGDYINVADAGQVLISNCYFRGNMASDTDAIDLDAVGKAEVSDCRFEDFRGPNSDGIDVGYSEDVLIENNIFSNITDKGLSIGKGSKVVARGNVFSLCTAGSGIKDEGSFLFSDRNTFYANETGIHCFEKEPGRGGGSALVVNSLFAGPAQNAGIQDEYSSIIYSYSWYDKSELPGDNNLTGNPGLLAPQLGIFSLHHESLCRDAGDPDTDLDPDASLPDIGARYFHHEQLSDLYVNELQTSGDELWFELYNAGSEAVSSWDLVVYTSPMKQNAVSLGDIFKTNVLIQAGQYELFELSNPDWFSNQDERLVFELMQVIGDELLSLSQLSIEPSSDGTSYGCYPNGSYFFRYFSEPTPGEANLPDGSKKGHLFINEILAYNSGGIVDETGVAEDWIEIYNGGNTGVNVAGLFLSDNFNNPVKWQIPDEDLISSYLAPGGFMIFWADGDTLDGWNHLNFKLDGNGEELGLFEFIYPDTLLVDSVSFGAQYTDVSYGRYPDGSSSWAELDNVTPGASNILLKINEDPFSYSLSIFPNPASDYLNLLLEGEADRRSRIDMIDLRGQILFSMPVASLQTLSRISLKNYPAGLYFIRLTTPLATHTHRFLKQ